MPESRYIRQTTLTQVGKEGQAVLSQARVAVVGLGALGSVSAEVMARAGVGFLRLIDRDYVSLNNLQRTALYTEADAEAATPKALAAAAHLEEINSDVLLQAKATHLSAENALELLAGVNLILDGADNYELRYLINEAADELGIPWIYAGALGTLGMTMPITAAGPCFRCLSPVAPPPGSYATCATAGVLATTTQVIANLQATLAIKMLLGKKEAHAATLLHLDVWEGELDKITVEKDPECPVCGKHRHELLDAGAGGGTITTTLCGRDEFQVQPQHAAELDLASLAQSLKSQGKVLASPVILAFDNDKLHFKLFADGRMMLKGAADEQQALSIYSEYVGL